MLVIVDISFYISRLFALLLLKDVCDFGQLQLI